MQYDKSRPGLGPRRHPVLSQGRQGELHRLPHALHRFSRARAASRRAGASGSRSRTATAGAAATPDGRRLPLLGRVLGARARAGCRSTSRRRRKHPELKGYFFGHLSGNRILVSRARSFVLGADAIERNYLVYPVARVDGARGDRRSRGSSPTATCPGPEARPPPTPVSTSDARFEPASGESWRDPFPMYAALREHDPVHHVARTATSASSRGFDDVWSGGGRSRRRSRRRRPHRRVRRARDATGLDVAMPMVFLDPPAHTALLAGS